MSVSQYVNKNKIGHRHMINLETIIKTKQWKEWNNDEPTINEFNEGIKFIAKQSTKQTEQTDRKYIAIFYKYNVPHIIQRYKRLKQIKPGTLTKYKMFLLYGKDEGIKRWDQYRQKQSYSNSFEYKQQKHNMSKKEFNSFNKSRAITLENQIKKYGKKEGSKRFKNYVETQKYVGSSVEYFISLHGEEKGKIIYDDIKKSKGITLENQIKKYGDFEGKIRYEQYRKKLASNHKPRFSVVSQQLFKSIMNYFDNKLDFYFAANQGERLFWLKTKNDKKVVFVDFLYKNVIIEFNGDIFHGNPELFEPNDTPNYFFPDKTCVEFWEEDKKRINELKKMNYNVLIIWENDYRNSESIVVEQCINYIKKYSKNNKIKECVNDLF